MPHFSHVPKYSNPFTNRRMSLETARYKKTSVGKGILMEKCLGECSTHANQLEYPYLGYEIDGELRFYLDPNLAPGNWIQPQHPSMGFGFGSKPSKPKGGTKRRRYNRSGSRRR
jgi:hypothetical protein